MGFYVDRILPYLIHLSMRNRQVARHRQRVIPAATGRVLEVGIGSGLNLPFYSNTVTEVVGVDPSARLIAMARRAADSLPFGVEFVDRTAEAMPFDDRSFDSVVSTWTLCSIPDAKAALTEMRRVLKPGGELIFIEHGASPDHRVASWQNRLNPIWTRLAGGCQINKPIDTLVTEAGFSITRLETDYLVKAPRVLTFHYDGRGVAGLRSVIGRIRLKYPETERIYSCIGDIPWPWIWTTRQHGMPRRH